MTAFCAAGRFLGSGIIRREERDISLLTELEFVLRWRTTDMARLRRCGHAFFSSTSCRRQEEFSLRPAREGAPQNSPPLLSRRACGERAGERGSQNLSMRPAGDGMRLPPCFLLRYVVDLFLEAA